MTSQYELDSMEISRIQFHTPELSQKERNRLISKIELKMEKMDDKENNGINTGYYS